jgi:hypothetical protein
MSEKEIIAAAVFVFAILTGFGVAVGLLTAVTAKADFGWRAGVVLWLVVSAFGFYIGLVSSIVRWWLRGDHP